MAQISKKRSLYSPTLSRSPTDGKLSLGNTAGKNMNAGASIPHEWLREHFLGTLTNPPDLPFQFIGGARIHAISQTFRNKETSDMEQHPEVPQKRRRRKETRPSESTVPSFQMIFIAGGTAGLKGCCSLSPDGTAASLRGVGYAGHGIPCSRLPSSLKHISAYGE